MKHTHEFGAYILPECWLIGWLTGRQRPKPIYASISISFEGIFGVLYINLMFIEAYAPTV